MKKFVLAFLLLALFVSLPVNVIAQEVGPTPTEEPAPTDKPTVSTIGENEATLMFGDLGFVDDTLQSPFDATRVRFSTPPNWQLVPPSELVIEYEVFFTGEDVLLLGDLVSNYAGELAVVFNNQAVGSLHLTDSGIQSAKLDIPADALLPFRDDGRHQLDINLLAGISCEYDIRTIVVIKSISYFTLSFEITVPNLSLATLPYPFYLRDSVVQEQSLIVLPENPDPMELQAAMNVSSGFGSMTASDFLFDIIGEEDLTTSQLSSANLIFVGQPTKFKYLQDVPFSLPVSNTGFSGLSSDSAEDGILQIAHSPWNETKAVLLISGNSLPAVNKAAQAFSTGTIFVNEDPTLVYVADVQTITGDIVAVENFTFEDLGYETQTMSGIGSDDFEYLFYISKEQVNTSDGRIDLSYFHSGSLDYVGSSLVVRLNDEVISSEIFSDESSKLTTKSINIPAGTLRFGENRLIVSGNLLPFDSCDTSGITEYYLTIENDSLIHIPVSVTDELTQSLLVDLQLYPSVFISRSDLGDVAFILPKATPSSWNSAAKIAFDLGRFSNASISNLTALYADDVPVDVREAKHMIFVGQSGLLPLLQEINDELPAPFDLETDTASERYSQVVYRLPPGTNVGYLEILVSPFSQSNALMVVSGNSTQGVNYADQALTLPELRNQLSGIFAVTNGTQVKASRVLSPYGLSIDQTSIVAEVFPEAEEVVAITVPELTVPTPQRPGWLTLFMTSSIVFIVVVLAIALIYGIRKSRSQVH